MYNILILSKIVTENHSKSTFYPLGVTHSSFVKLWKRILRTNSISFCPTEQLLREFFQFLCSFSFNRQGVSVRRGEPFPNIDENVPLHIENPLETDLNTSKNVSQKLLTLMQTHAKDALKMMEDPAFQKSDDGNTPWGLPLMFLLPSHMERGSNKSMGLGNRLTNILKGISSWTSLFQSAYISVGWKSSPTFWGRSSDKCGGIAPLWTKK